MDVSEVITDVGEISATYAGDEGSLCECLGDLLFAYREKCKCPTVEAKIGQMLEALNT